MDRGREMLPAQPGAPGSALSGLTAAPGASPGKSRRPAPPRTAPALSHAPGWTLPAPRQPGWDGNGKHRQSELKAAELTDRGRGEPGLSAANGVTH